jgi:hypothetical protein
VLVQQAFGLSTPFSTHPLSMLSIITVGHTKCIHISPVPPHRSVFSCLSHLFLGGHPDLQPFILCHTETMSYFFLRPWVSPLALGLGSTYYCTYRVSIDVKIAPGAGLPGCTVHLFVFWHKCGHRVDFFIAWFSAE